MFKVSGKIVMKMCLCSKNCYYNCQFRQNRKRAQILKSHTALKLVSIFKCFKSGTVKLRQLRSPVTLQRQTCALYVTILSFATVFGKHQIPTTAENSRKGHSVQSNRSFTNQRKCALLISNYKKKKSWYFRQLLPECIFKHIHWMTLSK